MEKAIGVFDSGLGGLTAVKELIKTLPNEKIYYFGDTARVPYGSRSRETVIKYTKQDINFLKQFGLKAIVVACGTVSSVALPEIKNDYDLPILGVVESSSKKALKLTKNHKIGILGTNATIRSNSYKKCILDQNSDVLVVQNSCPLFVPLVENGYFNKDNEVARLVATDYLKPLLEKDVDTIILGCTHYPILEEVIKNIIPKNINLINPGKETIDYLKEIITPNKNKNEDSSMNLNFYVSDEVDDFKKYARIFLGNDLDIKVKKIDIEKY